MRRITTIRANFFIITSESLTVGIQLSSIWERHPTTIMQNPILSVSYCPKVSSSETGKGVGMGGPW